MYLVVIAWIYVALMMAVAEANHSNGTLLGAFITFVLYGLGPVALVVYIMMTPARKKAIRAREAAELAALASTTPDAASDATPQASIASVKPDAGSEPATELVAPVRKEP